MNAAFLTFKITIIYKLSSTFITDSSNNGIEFVFLKWYNSRLLIIISNTKNTKSNVKFQAAVYILTTLSPDQTNVKKLSEVKKTKPSF